MEQVEVFLSQFRKYKVLQTSLDLFMNSKERFLYKINKQTLMGLQNDTEVQKLLDKLDVGNEFLILFQEQWMTTLTVTRTQYPERMVDSLVNLYGVGSKLWPASNANTACCFQSNREMLVHTLLK